MRTIRKVETIENNPSLFMIRGLLHYALADPDAAFNDLEKYLNESTKPSPLALYLIGIIFAETGRLTEAIAEFRKVIEQDKDHHIPEALLNMAKCMLLTGEVNTGFNNLQSYMSFRPSSPEIHVWAGHLLFFIGAYEDAAKAYSNINNVSKNFEVLLFKAKCYLTCKDVLNTLANLKLMLDIRQDPQVQFDYQLLDCLRECSDEAMTDYEGVRNKMKMVKRSTDNKFGSIFSEFDYQFYKAAMYFYDRKYAEASKNFKRAMDIIDRQMSSPNPPLDEQFYYDYKKLSFSNRSFNYFEAAYNMAVSDIMFGNHIKAYKALSGLLDLLPDGDTKTDFANFVALVQK
jgi:tetratricopeptide (TPR) repeat protein